MHCKTRLLSPPEVLPAVGAVARITLGNDPGDQVRSSDPPGLHGSPKYFATLKANGGHVNEPPGHWKSEKLGPALTHFYRIVFLEQMAKLE